MQRKEFSHVLRPSWTRHASWRLRIELCIMRLVEKPKSFTFRVLILTNHLGLMLCIMETVEKPKSFTFRVLISPSTSIIGLSITCSLNNESFRRSSRLVWVPDFLRLTRAALPLELSCCLCSSGLSDLRKVAKEYAVGVRLWHRPMSCWETDHKRSPFLNYI